MKIRLAIIMFSTFIMATATHAMDIGGRLSPNLFQLKFHYGAGDHRFTYGGWLGATGKVLKTTFTTPTRLHASTGKESKMSKVQKVAIAVGTIGVLYLAYKEVEDAREEKKKYKRRAEQLRKELESEREVDGETETETAGEGKVVNQDGARTSDITSKDDALVITELPEDGGVPAPRTSPPLNEKEEEEESYELPKDGGVPIIYIGKRDLENNPDGFDPESKVHNAEVKWCTRINGWCWRGKQMAHDYKPKPIIIHTPIKPKPLPESYEIPSRPNQRPQVTQLVKESFETNNDIDVPRNVRMRDGGQREGQYRDDYIDVSFHYYSTLPDRKKAGCGRNLVSQDYACSKDVLDSRFNTEDFTYTRTSKEKVLTDPVLRSRCRGSSLWSWLYCPDF